MPIISFSKKLMSNLRTWGYQYAVPKKSSNLTDNVTKNLRSVNHNTCWADPFFKKIQLQLIFLQVTSVHMLHETFADLPNFILMSLTHSKVLKLKTKFLVRKRTWHLRTWVVDKWLNFSSHPFPCLITTVHYGGHTCGPRKLCNFTADWQDYQQ